MIRPFLRIAGLLVFVAAWGWQLWAPLLLLAPIGIALVSLGPVSSLPTRPRIVLAGQCALWFTCGAAVTFGMGYLAVGAVLLSDAFHSQMGRLLAIALLLLCPLLLMLRVPQLRRSWLMAACLSAGSFLGAQPAIWRSLVKF